MSDTTDAKSKEKSKRPKFWSRDFRKSKPKAKFEASESSTITTKPVEANSDMSGTPVARVVEGQADVEVNPAEEKENLQAEVMEFITEMEKKKLSAKAKEKISNEINILLSEMETNLQKESLAKMRQRLHKIKHKSESGIGRVGGRTERRPKSSTIRAAIRSAPHA